jgi:WhiB family redox-sensing transcriptional regulator
VNHQSTDDPEAWMVDAACADHPVDWWFPTSGDCGSIVAEARRICHQCPVRVDCLDYALEHGIHHGIWGATTERERRRIRHQLRAAG